MGSANRPDGLSAGIRLKGDRSESMKSVKASQWKRVNGRESVEGNERKTEHHTSAIKPQSRP